MTDDTTQVANKALDMISSFAEQLKQVAEAHGPQAWQIALHVAQVNALGEILYPVGVAIVTAAVAITAFWFSKHFAARRKTFLEDHPGRYEDLEYCIRNVAENYSVGMWLSRVVGIFLVLTTLLVLSVNLSNPWPWVGLVHPELYLAKTMLKM